MNLINKFITFLKRYYRVDYLAHFIAGVGFTELFYTISSILGDKLIYYIISILLSIFIIFFKDIVYDKLMKKGTFEWVDIIMGCIGIIIVTIQWVLLLI